MKFGKLYKSAQHDAWVDYYIDYKGLKKVLKLAYDSQGSTTAFHEELWNQISQVNSFFCETEHRLLQQLPAALASAASAESASLFAAVLALHRFVVLNYVAVLKIVKKHDKAAERAGQPAIRRAVVEHIFSLAFIMSFEYSYLFRETWCALATADTTIAHAFSATSVLGSVLGGAASQGEAPSSGTSATAPTDGRGRSASESGTSVGLSFSSMRSLATLKGASTVTHRSVTSSPSSSSAVDATSYSDRRATDARLLPCTTITEIEIERLLGLGASAEQYFPKAVSAGEWLDGSNTAQPTQREPSPHNVHASASSPSGSERERSSGRIVVPSRRPAVADDADGCMVTIAPAQAATSNSGASEAASEGFFESAAESVAESAIGSAFGSVLENATDMLLRPRAIVAGRDASLHVYAGGCSPRVSHAIEEPALMFELEA
uniref:SPX domain-containing protein n=2 Tax=Chrysotila carterae TaxID=13221 RepID=A0A7S4EYT7_CHRCT|mmetsp:Transcript_2998/g.6220  ORF Transcript_2998/g.6220 Transcript_2998/m.6220 type:complete len:435 (+) Transcript_2998:254-1558(+)